MNRGKWIRAMLFSVIALGINIFIWNGLVYNTGMRLDFHYLETGTYDDIYVGDSKGEVGIDPAVTDEITGRRSMNLCQGQELPLDSYYMIRMANEKAGSELKRVILELDPSYYVIEDWQGIEDPFILNAMPFSQMKVRYLFEKYVTTDFRCTLFPWMYHRNGLPNFFTTLKQKTTEAYRAYDPSQIGGTDTYYSNGHRARKYDELLPKDDYEFSFETEDIKDDYITQLKRMIEYCRENDLEFIAVMLPVSEETLKANREDYERAGSWFNDFFSEEGVTFLNFNDLNLEFAESAEGYVDLEGHMWGQTARQFSTALGQTLKILDKQKNE